MASDEDDMLFKLVMAGSKRAVASGSRSAGLPEEVGRFLATQLAIAVDMVRKGGVLSPWYLTVLLTMKGFSIAALAIPRRHECAVSMIFLGLSLAKTAGSTLAGPGAALVTAAGLLAECYSADKACGVSDAVQERMERVASPAAAWLERGLVGWLSRGY